MSTTPTAQLLNRLRMRQVALLLAIGQHRTLRAAAAQLGLTQPAATKMLQELESAMGHALFDRVGRGLQLTAAGHCVLRISRAYKAISTPSPASWASWNRAALASCVSAASWRPPPRC